MAATNLLILSVAGFEFGMDLWMVFNSRCVTNSNDFIIAALCTAVLTISLAISDMVTYIRDADYYWSLYSSTNLGCRVFISILLICFWIGTMVFTLLLRPGRADKEGCSIGYSNELGRKVETFDSWIGVWSVAVFEAGMLAFFLSWGLIIRLLDICSSVRNRRTDTSLRQLHPPTQRTPSS